MAALTSYRFLLVVFLISSAALFTVSRASEHPEEKPFKYEEKEGNGPKNWGTLKPEWKTCGTGKLQSPIDMTNERVTILPSAKALEVNHKATSAAVVNRGHDIAVVWNGDAGGVNINGTDYKLLNIHWHSPSEHTLSGRSYDLEGHMVHKSADSGIAVIGVLYNVGRADPFLEKFLPAIKTASENGTSVGIVDPQEIKVNRNGYYRYLGSLTTPPCTEGVIWSLVTKVRTVSLEQLQALKAAVHDEKNARPVQEINGRTINLVDSKIPLV